MIHRMKVLAARRMTGRRFRRGVANRDVSPILVVVLGVVVVALIGGGFFLVQKRQAAEASKRTTSKEGAQKFFSNPDNLRKAREAAGSASPGQ